LPIQSLGGLAPQTPPEGAYWVAPDAQVIGRVWIGRDVGIWFGAVLRGDNEPIDIGEGANIQEHAMLHTDIGFPLTVGRHCTIGHRAILHGCFVGDGSLIGMGAIVLNGARIGTDCLVGAGALVTEGKTFPDRSLIMGVPARAVRSLDDDAVRKLRLSAENYVLNWRRFASELGR